MWNFGFEQKALTHNPKLAQAISEQSEFKELSHPAYSIGQTSSEYCLIQHLNNHTRWLRSDFDSSTPKSTDLGYSKTFNREPSNGGTYSWYGTISLVPTCSIALSKIPVTEQFFLLGTKNLVPNPFLNWSFYCTPLHRPLSNKSKLAGQLAYVHS